MWAWIVLWRSGKASGVELSFDQAKREADNSIRQVEDRIVLDEEVVKWARS